MISEKSFSHSYTSFWQGVLPLGDSFVRRLNRTYVNASYSPLASSVDASRRGLVNEMGFELFRMMVQSGRPPLLVERLRAAKDVQQKISALELKHALITDSPYVLDPAEWKEAELIERRLSRFFGGHQLLIVNPLFRGCGILNSCNGDVLADN